MSPWVRLDEAFAEHPKIASLSDEALALWVTGLAYCNRNLTDGLIPYNVGHGQLRYCGGNAVPAILELEAAGLWEDAGNGWRVHDFFDYQPSKADTIALREARKRAGAAGGKASSRAKDKHLLKQNPSKTQANGQAKPQAKSNPVPVPVTKDQKLLSRKPRATDPIWDTLVEIVGASPNGLERGKWNKARKSLAESGATPETLRAAALAYRRIYHDCALTPLALANNWTTLLTANGNGGGPRLTGWRLVRGSHGSTLIPDPNGTDRAPQ